LLVAVNLYGNLRYIATLYNDSPMERAQVLRNFDENLEMLKWVEKNLPQGEVLTAKNPPLVYLYTGHKTVTPQNLGENQDMLRRFNVRYLVYNSPFPVPNPDLRGGKYKIVYRSRGELNLYVVDLGLPDSR
jgi:hypothetical protein